MIVNEIRKALLEKVENNVQNYKMKSNRNVRNIRQK